MQSGSLTDESVVLTEAEELHEARVGCFLGTAFNCQLLTAIWQLLSCHCHCSGGSFTIAAFSTLSLEQLIRALKKESYALALPSPGLTLSQKVTQEVAKSGTEEKVAYECSCNCRGTRLAKAAASKLEKCPQRPKT